MAFNPGLETRRKPSVRAVSEDQESSFFSDSQTSWVLFNPSESRPHDILSLSTENPLTGTEDEADGLSESGGILSSRNIFQGRPTVSANEPTEKLADELEVTLSNRIKEWQSITDTPVSDNVASWDLDEKLVEEALDTTILQQVPAYYGDEYFKHMSRLEYIQFKRSSAILRHSLSKKGYNASDPKVITRLLSLLKWRDLLSTSGSLVDDYIVNTLSRVHFDLPARVHSDLDFSDTATSSSLVICGGNGGDSWNDI